jgi:ubiquitin-protein ligase
MYQSPRTRRLRNDLAALERLRSESSVFRFSAQGDPPFQYLISFQGRGLWRHRGKVRLCETHRVEIKLGASYPRTIPEIRWVTPIYHPNISEIGMVCLGGYGTHWVPSVQLDELCVMLWDMVRYHNYDIRSPYNRDAALWVANQTAFLFPTDARALRDLRVALGRVDPSEERTAASDGRPHEGRNGKAKSSRRQTDSTSRASRVRRFISRYGLVFAEHEASRSEGRQPSPPPGSEPGASPSAEVEASEAASSEVRLDELVILETNAPNGLETQVAQSDGDEIIFID